MCYDNCERWTGETCSLGPTRTCPEAMDVCGYCGGLYTELNPCKCRRCYEYEKIQINKR